MKKICLALFLAIVLLTMSVSVGAAPEAPQITLQPQNYHYPEYSVAVFTVKASGTNLHATWYLAYEGKTYNISDNTNGIEPWEGYAGENYGPMEDGPNTFSWFFGGIEEELNGAEIWCVIEDGHYDVTSAKAIITVQGSVLPPEIVQMPIAVSFERGDEAEIRCVAKSNTEEQLEFQWYETATGKLQDIRAIDGEETDYMFCDTETVGTRYYVCCVTDTAGGRVYSSVVSVTVKEADETTSDTTSEPTSENVSDTTSESVSDSDSENASGTSSESTSESSESSDESESNSKKSASFPWWGYLLVGVGCAGIGAVAAVVVIKFKKK